MKKRKELLVALMMVSTLLIGCNSQTTVDGTDTEANVNVTVEEQNEAGENALDYREYIGKTLGELTDSEKSILMDGTLNINNFDSGTYMENTLGISYKVSNMELPAQERTVDLEESIVGPYSFACVALNEVQLLVFNDSLESIALNDGRIVGYCIFDVDATSIIDTTAEEWLYFEKTNNHMYFRTVSDTEVELAAQKYYYYGYPFPNAVRDYQPDLEALGMWPTIDTVSLSVPNNYGGTDAEDMFQEINFGTDVIQIMPNTANDRYACKISLYDSVDYCGETITVDSMQSTFIEFYGADANGECNEKVHYGTLSCSSYKVSEEALIYLAELEQENYIKIADNENYSLYFYNYSGSAEDFTQNISAMGYLFDKTTGLTYYIFHIDGDKKTPIYDENGVITLERLKTFGEEFYGYVSTHILIK